MRFVLIILSLCLYNTSFSQSADTAFVVHKETKFYHLKYETNSNIMIFLHGGVNNPIFNDSAKTNITLNLLLEGNSTFIPTALENGFDIIVPITNQRMNWLENPQYCQKTITSYLDSINSPYNSRYISGFSDGGTGSYKIFYDTPDYYNGLIVFNGYPQHKNFNQTVKYAEVKNKKIAFFSTFDDNTIPYEFLLTEYCKQKKINPNTFLYIKEGAHSFSAYTKADATICFQILASDIDNTKTESIHGFISNDEVMAFYPYRKKIWRKYGYGKAYYHENQQQKKRYKSK